VGLAFVIRRLITYQILLSHGLNIMQNAKKEVRKKRIPDDKKMESVLDYINKKKSIKTIASECGVSEQSVRDWVNKYQNSTQADILPSIENVTDYIYTNITPIPLVYTLEEAASVAKISTNQLLHYAALGKVILFIARPIDSVVLTKWQIDLHSNDSSHLAKDFQQNDWFKNLKNSYKIPFLAISCSDCKCLEMGLSISKNEFGSVFDVQNDELIKLEDNNEKEDFYYVFNEDFIQKNEKNDVNKDRISIGISKSHLKLSSKELNQLVNDEIKRKANRVPSQEQFAVHENKSTFLVELDQAAFELWGDFNPIKAAVYNTSDKVAEYLEDNFTFLQRMRFL